MFTIEVIESNPHLGQLIPDAAEIFLKTTRDFDDFLKEFENTEIYGPKPDHESMPEFYIICKTGQLFFELEIFGDYVSRIFYEIHRELRGNFKVMKVQIK